MSGPDISGTSSTQEASGNVAQGATDAKTAPSGDSGAPQGFSSMGDLHAKAPEFERLLLIGAATTICNRMKHSQDKIHETLAKERRERGG